MSGSVLVPISDELLELLKDFNTGSDTQCKHTFRNVVILSCQISVSLTFMQMPIDQDVQLECLLFVFLIYAIDFTDQKHSDEDAHTEGQGRASNKPDPPAAHSLDHDLDMTQLCQAFAEDFTQEVCLKSASLPGSSAKISPSVVSGCAAMEINDVMIKEESEDVCKTPTDQHGVTSTTGEGVKDDGGCPEEASGTWLSVNGSESHYSGFQTASNKLIKVPPDAIMKAKALLDESVGSGLESARFSREVLPSTVKEDREASDFVSARTSASLDPCPTVFRTTTSEFKAPSVASASREKAAETFPGWEGREENTSEVEERVQNGTERVEADATWTLTASQKADVSELCSLLEEASSQYDFTQCGVAKASTAPQNAAHSEADWDSETLAGVDFDDSFGRGNRGTAESPGPNTEASNSQWNSLPDGTGHDLVNGLEIKTNLLHVESDAVRQDGKSRNSGELVRGCTSDCRIETGERNEKWSPTTDEKQICKSEIDLDLESRLVHGSTVSVGFRTARGKEVKISEKALQDANKLLSDFTFNDGASCGDKNVHSKPHPVYPCGIPADVPRDAAETKPTAHRTLRSGQGAGFEMTAMKPTVSSTSRVGQQNPKGINSEMESVDGTEFNRGKIEFDPESDPNQHARVNGFKLAAVKGVRFSEGEFTNAKDREPDSSDIYPENGRETAVMDDFGFEAGSGNVALLNVGLKEETPLWTGSRRRKSCNTSTDPCVFSTASGTALHVSNEALQRARVLLHDPSDEALKQAKHLFGDYKSERLAPDEDQDVDPNASSPSCKTFRKYSPLLDSSGTKARTDEATLDDPGTDLLSKERRFPNSDLIVPEQTFGFSTASGKKVAVSDQALEKARRLFTGCQVDGLALEIGDVRSSGEDPLIPKMHPSLDTTSENCHVINPKTEFKSVLGGNLGFDRRNGRRIQTCDQAKSLSAGCEVDYRTVAVDTEAGARFSTADKQDVSIATEFKSGNVLPGVSSGFNTAGGRRIVLSDEALEQAKSLFTECEGDFQASFRTPVVQEDLRPINADDRDLVSAKSRNSGDSQTSDAPGRRTFGRFGFSTASGKNVDVSEEALLNAKRRFADDSVTIQVSDGMSGRHGVTAVEESERPSMRKDPHFENHDDSIGGTLKANRLAALEMFHHDHGDATDRPGSAITPKPKSIPFLPRSGPVEPTDVTQAGQNDPHFCNPLNLDGCSDTQQKFLQQEAMACTKALLEDENSSSCSCAVEENLRPPRRTVGNTEARKRTTDDRHVAGKIVKK